MSDEPKKILVCESNAALAGMICDGLSKAGFECTLVEDGRDAWDKLEGSSFDGVITEYALRDSVGTEICRGIREHKQLASLPLIVTLGSDAVEPDALKSELNLDGVVKKPLSVKGLVANLQSVLSG